MNLEEIQAILQRAFSLLVIRDSDLFTLDLSEWTFAHRLAVYIEQQLPAHWHVDCEYNRQGADGEAKRTTCGGRIRPDISVHHRRKPEPGHNLLVIEMKKRDCEPDFPKAREYTLPPAGKRDFQYQFGVGISLFDSLTHWFVGGREINRKVIRPTGFAAPN